MDEASLADRLRLYLVADPDASTGPIEDVVEAALRGGVTAVQLRAKRLTDRQATELAKRLAVRCRAHGALFIVNDRLDITSASGADGVHLGVDDLPLEDARRIAGPDMVIGFSPETDAQAASAKVFGASYLGVGPVFGTASKSDAGEAIGISVVRRRVELAGIPVVGIGGITAANAPQVMGAGAAGVAVVSAILGAADPELAARNMRQAVERT